mmetsp:Transcript_50540/g.80503  ORF Transcript_50540/g.80503 Transcript_50540/m.80503 type:complete len:264 (+) Transcript_50540:533-1324(+)
MTNWLSSAGSSRDGLCLDDSELGISVNKGGASLADAGEDLAISAIFFFPRFETDVMPSPLMHALIYSSMVGFGLIVEMKSMKSSAASSVVSSFCCSTGGCSASSALAVDCISPSKSNVFVSTAIDGRALFEFGCFVSCCCDVSGGALANSLNSSSSKGSLKSPKPSSSAWWLAVLPGSCCWCNGGKLVLLMMLACRLVLEFGKLGVLALVVDRASSAMCGKGGDAGVVSKSANSRSSVLLFCVLLACVLPLASMAGVVLCCCG